MKGGKGKNESLLFADIDAGIGIGVGVGIVINFWHSPMVACCGQLWLFCNWLYVHFRHRQIVLI